ncbi:NAD(P)/FAD-dependent oxidoreductase [Bacillus dakarensis]|uniref:NAD(P)/FAD-dependent oxidoreductase n=1 Tax=Robertmurraya dakarensis TaxID=1926278 RepID=UPI00098222B2|nr:FAD-dependent monooxygenase [Bacillus dakarensis]
MDIKDKAIIIGGGISGKLVSRVLAPFFKEVVIIERDHSMNSPNPRKGAPQGKHIHALLDAGEAGLEQLFPGIMKRCQSTGAVNIHSTKELHWYHHGHWKLRYNSGYRTTLQSRPHLEWHIYQYIKELENVSIRYNTTVQDFLYQSNDNAITGVVIKTDNSEPETLMADLVVDASGTSSLSTKLLKKYGYTIPEDKVKIDLSYITKTYQLQTSPDKDWTIKMIYPNPPHEKMGGSISKVEGDRYMVTVLSYQSEINEEELLNNDAAFIELAGKLPKKDIYEEIKNGAPLDKTSIYRVPHISWKRFDKVKNLPRGLLLIGDSVCRINPVFGQGMSIAILEALSLKKLLEEQNSNLQEISSVLPKRTAKIIAPIWTMVITEDFRYPGTIGKKPFGLSLQQWYSKKIFQLSGHNQYVYDSFIKVMHLVKPTSTLLQPKILKDVLFQRIPKK